MLEQYFSDAQVIARYREGPLVMGWRLRLLAKYFDSNHLAYCSLFNPVFSNIESYSLYFCAAYDMRIRIFRIKEKC